MNIVFRTDDEDKLGYGSGREACEIGRVELAAAAE